MNESSVPRPSLPEGWYYPDSETAQSHGAELRRELPEGHLLAGKEVEVFAYRTGSDDVLLRHVEEEGRFTVVHLSWSGRRGADPLHPTVEFDGTFAGFLAEEERLYGLTPPNASPFCEDSDTDRLLRIAARHLAHFFQYTESAADELVRSFYVRWQSPGWGDDFYHHEGAFRSAALMHYSALHDGSTDFTGFAQWYQEQQFDDSEREALEYFRENYFSTG